MKRSSKSWQSLVLPLNKEVKGISSTLVAWEKALEKKKYLQNQYVPNAAESMHLLIQILFPSGAEMSTKRNKEIIKRVPSYKFRQKKQRASNTCQVIIQIINTMSTRSKSPTCLLLLTAKELTLLSDAMVLKQVHRGHYICKSPT